MKYKNIRADIGAHDTLPKVLRYNEKHFGDDTALRKKHLGIWNAVSWREYAKRVRHLALFLAEDGIGKGDAVALQGGNGIYWLCGALAAQSCGAVSAGIYADASAAETKDILLRTGAKVVIAEGEEQADKILALENTAPNLRRILYDNPRGMRKYDDPRLLPLQDALLRGEELADESPRRFDEMVDAGNENDSAMLIATAGATAAPKIAEISHGAFLRHVQKYLERDPKTAADEYVSAPPLPWMMETKCALGKSLACGMKINFAESPATLMDDLREIGPTFLLLPARSWERIADEVRARMEESAALKQALFRRAMRAGQSAVERGGRSVVADFFVFRALRDSMGFSRLTSAAAGGAALGADVYKFFNVLGVPLKQWYGQTELLGAYTMHSAEETDFETCGRPFDGVEIKIADADAKGIGKIIARNPNMMRGYYDAPQETAKAVNNGWMDTGDVGYFKNGRLAVIGRGADLSRTANGESFSPQHLEGKLKFSPHIGDAVVFGDGRKFLTAIICVRAEAAAKWAELRRIAFTSYADLAARPEVREMICNEVAAVNAKLPPALRVRKIVLLHKELDADDGELTRTQNLRREFVCRRYARIVNALYSDATETVVDAEDDSQNGEMRRAKTILQIETPPEK